MMKKSIRSTLREILEYEKYVIDEAGDGQEGLEKLIATKYDLALCDVKMPKWMVLSFWKEFKWQA